MINFGNIFKYQDDFYVYLVQTGDIIYAARIIDLEQTKALIKFRDRMAKNPTKMAPDKPLYCFVVLCTDDFANQAAHYGKPEMSKDIVINPISMLNQHDLKNLSQEIINDKAAAPLLKEVVGKIYGDSIG